MYMYRDEWETSRIAPSEMSQGTMSTLAHCLGGRTSSRLDQAVVLKKQRGDDDDDQQVVKAEDELFSYSRGSRR